MSGLEAIEAWGESASEPAPFAGSRTAEGSSCDRSSVARGFRFLASWPPLPSRSPVRAK